MTKMKKSRKKQKLTQTQMMTIMMPRKSEFLEKIQAQKMRKKAKVPQTCSKMMSLVSLNGFFMTFFSLKATCINS